MGDQYEVGYARPPKHTQFRKGESGNPKGRPRGRKNLRTDLKEELAERITVREDGRTRAITKQRAVVKALVAGTIKGSARSTGPLLTLIARLLDADVEEAAGCAGLSNDERELLALVERRVAGSQGRTSTSAPASLEEKVEAEDRR